tara:strand:- start:16757 stop:17362 length:606 start_codon:yes stop_codon:yes gene_type:complete
MQNNIFHETFIDSIKVKNKLIEKNSLDILKKIGDLCVRQIMCGNKIIFCGNGGSAADAQHLAAELLVRLRPNINRDGIPALALSLDVSTLTACGNDFGYEEIFARSLQSLGQEGDILISITTSGNSENILKALKVAKKKKVLTVGFLGGTGGKVIKSCDLSFLVPSSVTARIQESHITAGHALMEYIEEELLKKKYIKLLD